MIDIKDLRLDIELNDIHEFMIKYEQQRDFLYRTFWRTFDESEANETITNRIITLSTEIIVLNMFEPYINAEELEAKRKNLNEELENMKELRAKTNMNKELRKGTNDGEYERIFNVLNQI